jgi:hypothetical protein
MRKLVWEFTYWQSLARDAFNVQHHVRAGQEFCHRSVIPRTNSQRRCKRSLPRAAVTLVSSITLAVPETANFRQDRPTRPNRIARRIGGKHTGEDGCQEMVRLICGRPTLNYNSYQHAAKVMLSSIYHCFTGPVKSDATISQTFNLLFRRADIFGRSAKVVAPVCILCCRRSCATHRSCVRCAAGRSRKSSPPTARGPSSHRRRSFS